MSTTDPHREWFERFRRCRSMTTSRRLMTVGVASIGPESRKALQQEAERLQRRIVMTEATTKDGLLAQAQLMAVLIGGGANSHLARAVVAGIERLVPER